eukprot:gene818-7835_t
MRFHAGLVALHGAAVATAPPAAAPPRRRGVRRLGARPGLAAFGGYGLPWSAAVGCAAAPDAASFGGVTAWAGRKCWQWDCDDLAHHIVPV